MLPAGVPIPRGLDIGISDAESAELFRNADYYTLPAGLKCPNCLAKAFSFFKLDNGKHGCYNCYKYLFPRHFRNPDLINLKINF